MFNAIQKWWRPLAIGWLIVISILFILPGSALPKENWLSDLHFDKWVHFAFFALLTFLWRFYFDHETRSDWIILFLALCYGIGIEVIQHFLITNRSFDTGDVMADMAGGAFGLWYWRRRYIKKIDPCRNRGRNQN